MRHPVSTVEFSGGDFGCGSMDPRVVGCPVLPGSPEDADPGAGENADGVLVFASALSCSAVDVGGPCGGMSRVVCKAG